MTMPWQLAKAKRPRKSSQPILEQLPCISVNQLRICSLSPDKTYIIRNQIKWPFVASIKLAWDFIEFHLPSLHRGQLGPMQSFAIKPIKTGFGIRHAFVCNCGEGVLKLYHHNRRIACRYCHRGRYASQAITANSRPSLQAARIQHFLDNKTRLLHRTRERLQKRLGANVMIAQRRLGTRATALRD
jgi:hypothetical protein